MLTSESAEIPQRVSTGRLPDWNEVDSLTDTADERYRDLHEGTVADCIPAKSGVAGRIVAAERTSS